MRLIFFLRSITKTLYKFRGLSRVADLVRRWYMHTPRSFWIHDFDGDLSFYCNLQEHISSQIFWRGHYSRGQLTLLRQILRPDMVFVDVGANKGEFTIFAAKYLPAGKVISFEPVQALSEELAANVAANHFKLVQIIPLGLGNIAQERILFNAATQYEGEWNQGVFSLYPRDHLRDAYEVVRTVRMDDLLKEGIILRIDMLKIDIEGAELEMLQGAAETIQRWMPVIFIEINALTCQAAGYQPGDILSFLEAFGYGFHAINRNGGTKPVTKDHLKIFQNLLCLPPSYKR